MLLKRLCFYCSTLLLLNSASSQETAITSVAMNKVRMDFKLDEKGAPVYAVYFNQQPVIQPSHMGFRLVEDSLMDRNFELMGTDKKSVDESWKPIWGEVSSIRNHYEQIIFHIKQKGGQGHLLDIIFRVFEDGVAFRYEFPKQPALQYFTVADELTQFILAGDHTAFWIPGDYDSNEYTYTTSRISEVDAWKLAKSATEIAVRVAPDQFAVQTPLLLKTKAGLYINIHEAALVDYSTMQLHVDKSKLSLTSSLVPDAVGNKAYLHAPSNTPWRTIIVSDKATDLLASKMILNLNEPSEIENTSWIEPMKFVGIWWEMQIGKSTWSYSAYADSLLNGALIPSGKHGANTANVKRYIDFASQNGIKGVLVEGWNTGWEDWFGNWKENVFDFVTPYPDFNVKELTSYAASKGVNMIMHNETSGSATNYDRQMDTAFRFMNQMVIIL